MIKLNSIYNENYIDTMATMPPNFMDMIIISPPYNDMRSYKDNNTIEFKRIANSLYGVIKDGGVIAWIIGDQTKNWNESGTSFRQIFEYMFIFSKGKPKIINLIYDRENKDSGKRDKGTKKLYNRTLRMTHL